MLVSVLNSPLDCWRINNALVTSFSNVNNHAKNINSLGIELFSNLFLLF